MRSLLVVLLLSPLLCVAQPTTIDTLHWSATRRLQLDDFHLPAQPGLGGSEFYYQLGYEIRRSSIWSQPAIEAFCLMFRNLSWVSETARNERTLAYNQVLFDLVEVHARLMKARLIALEAGQDFKQRATEIEYLTNAELGRQVNWFRAETGGGDDPPALQRWQRQVAQQLYDTPDLVTTYRASKVGVGVFLGAGGALPTGSFARTLHPPVGAVFGVDIAFRRTVLLLHPTVYNGVVRQTFTRRNQTWEGGLRISSTLLEVGLGRLVSDSPRSRLMPYVGYRLLELSPRDRSDERYRGYSQISHAPTAGLVVDIKLGDNSRRTDRPEDSAWFVRVKAAYSPVLDTKPFAGGLINLQLGVSGFGRVRRVTYRPERTTIAVPGSLI